MELLCHTVLKTLVRRHVAVLSSTVDKDRVDWGMKSLLSEQLSNWLIIAQWAVRLLTMSIVYSTNRQMTEFQDRYTVIGC